VAWGTFAFGAVYEWAYIPLAWGCALVGLLGITTGSRPALGPNRLLLTALLGIAVIGAVQLVPLSRDILAAISPGTAAFLARFDLSFTLGADPSLELAPAPDVRHPISLAPETTLRALSLLGASLLFFLGLARSLSRTAASRLATGVVFLGLLLAVVGIVQKAALGDHAFGGMRIYGFWQPEFLLTTPFGPFVNKNHFAGWMLMGIPLALGRAISCAADRRPLRDMRSVLLWLSEPTGGRVMLYLVIAFVMLLSLLMTGSRSGLACFTLVVCGAAAWTGWRGGSRKAAIGAALATIALVLVALQWAGRDAALERFTADNQSIGMRLDIWRMSAGIVRDFPLFGTGLNTFGKASILYQPPRDMHYNEAHNDYVQLLVEGGAVTLVLVLLGMAGIALAVRARFRSDEDGREAYWIRVGATTGLLAIALQSMVEFSLQMPGNAALFVVLLALAVYVPAPLRHDDRHQPAERRSHLDAPRTVRTT
jgi:O-antigen ligase